LRSDDPHSEDRVKAVNDLLGSLGGGSKARTGRPARSVYAVLDLPDSSDTTAVAAVMMHTGAFKNVEVHEVLTQDQFNAALELADNVAELYSPPGASPLRDDSSESRFQR
jgi:hypothetical protein